MQYVFNTEAHPVPIWGSNAEAAVLSRMGISPLEDLNPWDLTSPS